MTHEKTAEIIPMLSTASTVVEKVLVAQDEAKALQVQDSMMSIHKVFNSFFSQHQQIATPGHYYNENPSYNMRDAWGVMQWVVSKTVRQNFDDPNVQQLMLGEELSIFSDETAASHRGVGILNGAEGMTWEIMDLLMANTGAEKSMKKGKDTVFLPAEFSEYEHLADQAIRCVMAFLHQHYMVWNALSHYAAIDVTPVLQTVRESKWHDAIAIALQTDLLVGFAEGIKEVVKNFDDMETAWDEGQFEKSVLEHIASGDRVQRLIDGICIYDAKHGGF